MYPIFFSVTSEDVGLAEEIWGDLPDDWVYLYSRSGVEGASFWDEIARKEIPQSRIFVVFWSKDYPKKAGCIRELEQAQALVSAGHLTPIVLRLDDTPIFWNASQSTELKPVFDLLRPLLSEHRTSHPGVSAQHAFETIAKVAEPLLRDPHPMWPRTDLEKAMRKAVEKERFKVYPAVWVAGFNGVGRETLVREFYRPFAPNGRGVVIDVNESSLPRQILLRIESEAFGASRERLQALAKSSGEVAPRDVAEAVQRVFDGGDYVIFRHNRIVEEKVELPEWLDDVVNALEVNKRVKLFIISQIPLLSDRNARCREAMVQQRVPTMDEHQMTEFCIQLIGHFDAQPERWTDDDIARIVVAAGGNLGFLVSLIRSAARLDDLDQINTLVAADSARMAEAITVYVRWAFRQLGEETDVLRTLLFLNDVTPCHIEDLEKAVNPSRPMLRVLGRLIALGLVESEVEEVYRLTPLLANRLQRDLIRPDLINWLDEAMRSFAGKPVEFETESNETGHEYLRLESRIQAALLSDGGSLHNSLAVFISAAHWFQAGIRLYHRKHSAGAFRLLEKAFDKRHEFANASRVELLRYYCLAATRARQYSKSEQCITLLDSVHTTKPMAAFLRADMHEYKRNYPEAIEWYEKALTLNQDKDSRIERTYRPLINCILRTYKPDFRKAERYSKDYLRLTITVFSLMSLVRVYLRWKYRGPAAGRDVPEDIDRLLSDALQQLEQHPGGQGTWYEMLAEQAEFENDAKTAVTYIEKAIDIAPRIQLTQKRWLLMVKAGDIQLVNQVIEELEAAKHDPEFRGNWQGNLPMWTEIYVRALKAANRPTALANTFAPELTSGEIGRIIGRSSREVDPSDFW